MSIIELKSSLGYIYYSLICFLIQIYCSISNLRLIRYSDSLLNDSSLIFPLIIVSFSIVGSSISNILNLFNGFGNSIEDYPFYKYKISKRLKSFPLLTLFDILNSILILLPKVLVNTQLIKSNLKDQSYVFESSIDFVIGNGISRVKKDGLSILKVDTSSNVSCEILNLFLILIRYNFIYSNCFYKINLLLSIIIIIHSIISIILSILIYSLFEIFFKQLSLINNSINIYLYLLIISLIISILFILLTNHGLYHYGKLIFIRQKYRIQNQLIRLSNFDDRYLNSCEIRRSLVYYLLFVMLSVTCQIPFIILTLKYLLSNLIDYLLLIYLTFLLIFILISIIIFTFLCLSPFNYFKQINPENSFYKSNSNVEEKLFHIESPRLIPTRSISSSGLTVIDYQNSNGRISHPSFEQTPGIATDTLLVMH